MRRKASLLLLTVAIAVTGCSSVVPGGGTATTDQHGNPLPSTTTTTTDAAQTETAGGGLVLATAEEIEAALTGNTIIGNWLGEDYRQFFAEDGETTYRPTDSGRDSTGEWRVNVESDLYESLWNDRGPWEEYEVHRDGETWFWTGQGVELSAFVVVEGNQLSG